MQLAGISSTVYGWLRWTWGGYPISSSSAGYNILSGPASDLAYLGIILTFWRSHNCHVRWCPLFHWRPHPDDECEMLCRLHHPDGHGFLRKLLVPVGVCRVHTLSAAAMRHARHEER